MSRVVVVATFKAKQGKEAELLEGLRNLAENSHAEAGCLNSGYDRIAASVAGSNEKYVSWRSVLNTLNQSQDH